MDHPRLALGSMEDSVGIPEELRCKRSDGKQWRCNALSMPDKTVCEKHYIQAKKRAANSAMRASLKKAKHKYPEAEADVYLERRDDDPEMSRSLSPMSRGGGIGPMKKYKDKVPKSHALYSPETVTARGYLARGLLRSNGEQQMDAAEVEDNRTRSVYHAPLSKEAKNFSGGRLGDYSGRSSDSSGEAEGLTCHQCRRSDRANVVWCFSCDRKGYCTSCISRWYADIPIEDIRKVCPACRNICSCRVCLRGDNLIKIRVQEIVVLDQLRYLHRLLAFVLPMLKQIYAEQCHEIGIETRAYGIKDIPRAKIHADEQMCCDFCRIPVFDYHRHCTSCSYDLCLSCCRDLRQASQVAVKGEPTDHRHVERSKDIASAAIQSESSERRIENIIKDENAIDFLHLFPKWKANTDGSIPCPPEEAGGCGSSKLVLRRILKINWVSKLVKNAEEMVSGCKVADPDGCISCTGSTVSQLTLSDELKLQSCSHRDGTNDNFLYCPASDDLKHEGIDHFHKHWVKGEPIIVKCAFDPSLASSWDPVSIWKGIQEMVDEHMKEDNVIVKAIDCLDQSEVDIQLNQFIKGYTEGRKREDGWPEMLKLKDWPPPGVLEEFILCHRPEFLSNLPLLEFIHSKWGILNLAAKLPHDTVQTEVGPQIFIAYGMQKELGEGDPVSNLRINMSDLVYLLMHTSGASIQGWHRSKAEKNMTTSKDSDTKESCGKIHDRQPLDFARSSILIFKDEVMVDQECSETKINYTKKKELDLSQPDKDLLNAPGKAHAGAIWDVFRRQDVLKLNEYLRAHQQEFTSASSRPVVSVACPVYDQAFYLNKDHKRQLKEEFGIEPWTFKQHVGEAVFIPAGCPFQVRNLQSSVQLGLDFLSPESLHKSVHLAQEIRCLPNDHEAKLKMMEVRQFDLLKVGKISLYAASWAIREIQKIILDPKFSLEIRFEDQNLTAMVSQNLEKMTKRRPIVCT